MRTLTLKNRFQGNSTIIENDFIDHYMVKANGEYVKVYLLLLRHLNTPDCSLTISTLADCLECTEKDIVRALNHWSNEGLLKIEYDEAGRICGIAIGKSITPESPASNTADNRETAKLMNTSSSDSLTDVAKELLSSELLISEASSNKPETPKVLPTPAPVTQEELRQLYFVAEQYIGRPLSVSEIQKINYFIEHLHFSVDLIEYLIEYCVENGHKSMHYIESVALAWSDAKISTVTEAKASSAAYNKNCFAVLKAFGIKGRNPAPIEVSYIKKWTDEYGFSLDIILEACNRTIANTSKPDFKYADSILKNWLSKNVRHLADIARIDQAYQQEKASRKQTVSNSGTQTSGTCRPANTNRFNNFESRSYDMTSLEQQLLNTP